MHKESGNPLKNIYTEGDDKQDLAQCFCRTGFINSFEFLLSLSGESFILKPLSADLL